MIVLRKREGRVDCTRQSGERKEGKKRDKEYINNMQKNIFGGVSIRVSLVAQSTLPLWPNSMDHVLNWLRDILM